VYLQRLEETAYFRADLRRCRHQIELSNGSKYWVYIRGPVEQSLVWMQSSNNYINKLNNTLQMYITANEETVQFFHRFAKIKLNHNNWEVQTVDAISTPGIIEVILKEDFNNTIKDDLNMAVQNSIDIVEVDNSLEEGIIGPTEIYPYETHIYELKINNAITGVWTISKMSRKNVAAVKPLDGLKVEVNVLTGKSATFQLDFISNDSKIKFSLPITVKSL
jgi:hypothetical protein